MKNINTYLNEQLNNRILEKLTVSKNNYDPTVGIVPKEWFNQDDRICLHFDNFSALMMYDFALEGEIVDGKYNNARPDYHWEWTKTSFFTVDGNEFYTGSSIFRIPDKKYNINGLVRTVKKMLNGQVDDHDVTLESATYLYNYGKMGKCLTPNEQKKLIVVSP